MSDEPGIDLRELLARARNGDAGAVEELLAVCRDKLILSAKQQLDKRLRVRLDSSDVVQQTLLEAHRYLPTFRGTETTEWWAWLHRILINVVRQEVRKHLVTKKRRGGQSLSLQDTQAGAVALLDLLEGTRLSPSHAALLSEQRSELRQAIDMLPDDQAAAIRMRYLDDLQIGEIAEVMGRTELSIGGLLRRGVQRLRELL